MGNIITQVVSPGKTVVLSPNRCSPPPAPASPWFSSGGWGGASLTSPVALDGGITGLTSLNLTPLLITCRISRLAPRGVLS